MTVTLRQKIKKFVRWKKKLHTKPRRAKFKPGDLIEVTQEIWGGILGGNGGTIEINIGDKVLVTEPEVNSRITGFHLRTQTKIYLGLDPNFPTVKRLARTKGSAKVSPSCQP
jgi:ribosomal protein S17